MCVALIQQQGSNMQQQPKETNAPTHADVLLGRGVATNRHPGNENFRAIVGRHVEAYVTSTKKQKMNISKSIVEQVHTLSPPGKFLERNSDTGLWHEVDQKRALEKTAQALRDGAAPLRKRMAEDLSVILSISDHGPRPKKQRTSNPVLEVLPSMQRNQQAQLHQQNQSAAPCLSRQPFLSQMVQSKASSSLALPENPLGINSMDANNDQDQELAQVLSHTFMQQMSALQRKELEETANICLTSMPSSMTNDFPSMTSSERANIAVTAQLIQDKNAIDEEEFSREMGPDEHFFDLCDSAPMNVFDGGDTNIFDSFDDILDEEAATNLISDGSLTSTASGATDEEEFVREMGSDEHFFDLCNGYGDIDIFDSFNDILDD